MNKIYILAIIFTFVAEPSFAQKSDDWFGFSGRARVTGRYEQKPTENLTTLRGQLRLDPWVNISPDGCVKLRARISSGNNYNSEWIVADVLDGQESIDISFRRLYVDMKCLKNVTLQAGAMGVETSGRLGLSDYGWVDGARVIVQANNKKLIMTVGEISDLKIPNLFQRNHSGVNYYQAEYVQGYGDSKNNEIFVSLSEYDDAFYSRAGLKYALEKYFEWLKYVAAEAIFTGQDRLGHHFEAGLDLNDWIFRLCFYNLQPNPSEQDKLNLLVKNFYGYGNNYYVDIEKDIGKPGKWNLQIRLRDGDAKGLVETTFTRALGKK